MYKILSVNLGTASSKVALFEDDRLVDNASFNHPREDMAKNETMGLQMEYRKPYILNWLSKLGESMDNIDAVGVRIGDSPRILPGGTYLIEGELEEDVLAKYVPNAKATHGNYFAYPLVKSLINGRDIKCFFTDAVNIDEFPPVAKISGHPLIVRQPIFHALNQRMVAIKIAAKLGKPYNECNLIVAHLGGGITVGAHQYGKVVEVNNGYGEEGGFSTTRCGYLPVSTLINLCFSGKFTKAELLDMVRQTGGVLAYLGTDDMREVEKMIENGDEKAALVYDAMAYQTAKQIAACAVALEGKIDGIILTGGIINSKKMATAIRRRVEFLGQIFEVPGEMENEAMAAGALRVLKGEQKPMRYTRDAQGAQILWDFLCAK
jgi:butyrate kinase